MSQFSVPVVRLGKVGKHPNADSLSITTIEGCPVIFRTVDFEEGQLVIYVPVDAIVPETVPGTEFLGKKRRIRAARLRGIFSMGLLLPLFHDGAPIIPMSTNVGEDVSGVLGITKWEEPEDPATMGDDQAPAPKIQVPVYDVESWRKYGPFEGDPIVEVTEKIHGTNSRSVFVDGVLHVGSHRTWKKENEANLWWRMAAKYGLKDRLNKCPGMVFYYETFGQVQDLTYGIKGAEIRVFDIFDSVQGIWLSTAAVMEICDILGLPYVPILYRGHQSGVLGKLDDMAKGQSTLGGNIREGVVIKTVNPGYDRRYGRTILKLVGEDYLLRKGGTERH